MGKVYQSAQGKMVDMTALAAKNERVRAVGNMNVNTRGDIIDNNDNIINDSSKRVNNVYSKLTQNVGAVSKQAVAPEAPLQRETIVADDLAPVEEELLSEFDEPNPEKEEPKKGKKR